MRERNRGEWKFDARLANLDTHGACFIDLGDDSPPATDYTPVANASKESAQIMSDQADRVLAESQRQYERNLEVAKPVVDAQLGIMRQTEKQAADQYERQQSTFSPIEDKMAAEAMVAGSEQDQEEAAGRAVADSRVGQTQAQNGLIRTGLRYGYSPAKTMKLGGIQALGNASMTAGAANAARLKAKEIGWAKKADVAGLGRNLTGASQGAYSLALNSGNSAVGNTMAPGTQLQNGTQAAAGIVGQGQQMQLNGLTNVANLQTSAYNSAQSQSSSMGGLGSMLGGAASLYSAFKAPAAAAVLAGSSKKIKTNKKPVSAELITKGLQRVPVEAWSYKDGEGDGGEHVGPYAEDVQHEFGDAAAPNGNKIDLVTMNGLAIAGVKNSADRLDRIEQKLGLTRRASA